MSHHAARVFSGLQPTGIPHIGNYFGALAQWLKFVGQDKLTHDGKTYTLDKPIYCVVDIHACKSSNVQFGQHLYDNILSTTASLIAAGLNPDKCILFKQSDVADHTTLANYLDVCVTTSSLARLSHFTDKSKVAKAVHHGLLSYPLLQAADILLYKANFVPIGQDQLQHIEITRKIAKKFNSMTKSDFFPLPEPILAHSIHSRRIKSLRAPDLKMSKSDVDQKAYIEIIDEPDLILDKCKKAITDQISQVYYDQDQRPGISNLMRIYHLATGDTFDQIANQFKDKESVEFKLKLADILTEKFRPVRDEYKRLIGDKFYLEKVLAAGAHQARLISQNVIAEIKCSLGLSRRV